MQFMMRSSTKPLAEAGVPTAAISECSFSEGEARAISKEVGVALREPAADRVMHLRDALESNASAVAVARMSKDLALNKFGQPCTFLKGGRCSIYAYRPMACRQLFNLDKDDLLCRLVPDANVHVPYLDLRTEQIAYILSWGPNSRAADVRDWFEPA